jgi:predicted dehydrogenase
MSSDNVHIGFVGAGFMGQLAHLSNYTQIDGCNVVALAEPRDRLAQKVTRKYGIDSRYETHAELLEKADIDAVIAAQPYARYRFIVPDILKKEIPVFTEKPVAVTPESGEELARLGQRHDTLHMVGYHKRSDPAMEYAKSIVDRWCDTGEYGELQYVRVTMPPGDWIGGTPDPIMTDEEPPEGKLESPPEDFNNEASEAYNEFINYYIHQVNALRFVFDEPYEVSHTDTEGHLLAVESESGVTGTLEMEPYTTSIDWRESILVGFEEGCIEIELPAPLASQEAGTVEILRVESDDEQMVTRPEMPNKAAMRKQAENFIAAVCGDQTPPCTAAEAAKDLEIAREYINQAYDQNP